MLRVQYHIGERDSKEIFDSLYKDVSRNDVIAAITTGQGASGKDIILLAKTPTGIEFLTFMVLKWSHIKNFRLDEIPE
jgi:hypothetical protein